MSTTPRPALLAFAALLATSWALALTGAGAPARCYEDQPCWNCHTMGNRVCGVTP